MVRSSDAVAISVALKSNAISVTSISWPLNERTSVCCLLGAAWSLPSAAAAAAASAATLSAKSSSCSFASSHSPASASA